MTITPEEARKMTEAEKAAIGQLERAIDKALREQFQDCPYSAVTYSLPSRRDNEVTGRVRKEIIRMYEEAGWNVKYDSSQFDGEWLQFTPKGGYGK